MKLIKLPLRVLTNVSVWVVWLNSSGFNHGLNQDRRATLEMVTQDLFPGGNLAEAKFLDRFTSNDTRFYADYLVRLVLKTYS